MNLNSEVAFSGLRVGSRTSEFGLKSRHKPDNLPIKIMKTTRLTQTTLTAAMTLIPILAQAHPGHGAEGLGAGLAHPALGLDHLLTMIAVGLWAVQLGGRARWIVPASFVSMMAAGFALSAAGISLPFVESGILASILVLGVLIAAAVRLPVAASAILMGVFALLHGHAHGTELPANSSGAAFAAGMIATTIVLQALGMISGALLKQMAQTAPVRMAGAAITLAGLILCFN